MSDHEGGNDDDNSPNYVAPKKVGLSDLVNQDAGDESLKKYKEALLGAAASGSVVSRKFFFFFFFSFVFAFFVLKKKRLKIFFSF